MPPTNTRIGFHYYPDQDHFRKSDLNKWLPQLKSLGASWLTLSTPLNRAIPESFLRGLIDADIEPILHFQIPIANNYSLKNLENTFTLYASWGVKYAVVFDKPNSRDSWSSSDWTKSELVERFLDFYLPVAKRIFKAGLIPILPPLEPGGDFWDTSFLRGALQGIKRRGYNKLLDSLAISAYLKTNTKTLSWGAGGPERWPEARPYSTPPNHQNHIGPYIFDWYLTIAKAVLGKSVPILLFGAGDYPLYANKKGEKGISPQLHTSHNLALAKLMASGRISGSKEVNTDNANLPAVPSEVLTCNFWLLTSKPDSEYVSRSWIKPDGSTLPIVEALNQWVSHNPISDTITDQLSNDKDSVKDKDFKKSLSQSKPEQHSINHYLLLPQVEWGKEGWHLDAIRPFIKKYHPIVGYSLDDASCAEKVTVAGGENFFSDEDIQQLRTQNCKIERIQGVAQELQPY